MEHLVRESLTLGLAWNFLWSGGAKLGSPGAAGNAMGRLFHLRPSIARYAARGLAVLEVAAAVLLMASAASPAGPVLSVLLGFAIVTTFKSADGRAIQLDHLRCS